MPYRGVQPNRHFNQTTEILQQAGHTATWRQYVSASAAGASNVAGFGDVQAFREQIITAFFGGGALAPAGVNRFTPRPVGMLAAGQLQAVTQQPLGVNDEIEWRGVKYRVDSESTPALMDGYWINTLTRGGSAE